MTVEPDYLSFVFGLFFILWGLGGCIWFDLDEFRCKSSPLSERLPVIIFFNLAVLGLGLGFGSAYLSNSTYKYAKTSEIIELNEQMPKNLNYISQKEASIPSEQFSYLNKKGEQKTLKLNEDSRIFWKKSKENKLVVTKKTNYSIFSKKLGTEVCKLTVYYTE